MDKYADPDHEHDIYVADRRAGRLWTVQPRARATNLYAAIPESRVRPNARRDRPVDLVDERFDLAIVITRQMSSTSIASHAA